VEEIQIFTTRLCTADNRTVVVPNAKITTDVVTNFNARGTRRVDLVIGIAYREDLSRVKRVIGEVLAADPRILRDPAPVIGVLQLAESSITMAVRPWTAAADYWGVYFDTLQRLKERFDTEGIDIPLPQRTITVVKGDLK
jgi:small conductance mechanosensitive channel